MLHHIYLADYLGVQSVLEDLAGFLEIDRSNPRGIIHQRVRNVYLMCKYIYKRQRAVAETCRISREKIDPWASKPLFYLQTFM